MDPTKTKIPPMMDLTIDNITENTVLINSQSGDQRLTYVMERLVTHLHDFARETRLSTSEWMAALDFLVKVGQISSSVRHEFILLSDILGLSLLVDAIDHPKPPSSTEGSVLGPFHTHDPPTIGNGSSMASDPQGEPCLVICTIKDVQGNAIEDVKIDIWETDSTGHYDVQYENRQAPDGRCVMKSDKEGGFWFKAIVPVPYPIPHDGPVGDLLKLLHRHPWRPAHMHFMFEKSGWDNLITAVYIRNDPYESSDAVFGVKKSLVVDFTPADAETAKQYGVKEGTKVLKHDFVLVSAKDTEKLRDENALKALKELGLRVKLIDHLPVPDLD
ncbi:Aromatic compound dioxygenase [Venustampulla echinocandica]|uniref:Aromatic compound dioxygenase n=1 Tax=Venustampulla echinocandica TaxID=2656787 RepID=A0A370TZU0_9HELO|nr:Aromatic compound dioxygenase [Venustampulla echinocandica]RDL41044.1 Aromatic compound dioxygenase [Venustampulla echinocandica]